MSEFEYVRNCWYPIGFSEEFETSKLKGLKIADKPVVVWRTEEGEVVAFDDRCCHKRFPLSESKLLDNGNLECAYHGLQYDSSGQCVEIPSQADRPIPKQAHLRNIPVCEQDRIVWMWPGDPSACEGIAPPRTQEAVDENLTAMPLPQVVHSPSNYLLLIENLLDISHFYPLHDGNIGDRANSDIPVQLEEGEQDGFKYVRTIREVENYKQPPYFREWFHYEVIDRVHTHTMVTPGLTRVVMNVAPPGQLGTDMERGYTLLHLHYPVDKSNLVWRILISSRKGHTPLNDTSRSTTQAIADMFHAVVAEDEWALERQQKMMEYPDEGYSELFLGSDAALRRARQIMLSMQRAERQAEPAPRRVRVAQETIA
ncbi:aromatic ring-hydroxylating dioxygenase subunit alpha [Pusillimonas caeni]|uniref:aromatic ring-hydroxylating dioxygenase subunit alpha n=1 Tax=Pusillimonas caeni TaxID=1348472 RepID=UPI000E59A16A|nr:aromatic ring-hydroxylating dioxygenase subunit alpha [Pusillimonas caeni]TFL13247.1 aromatic ring-hydroxylating dioxygenase subunit alpha [Pusillimonas caeni]